MTKNFLITYRSPIGTRADSVGWLRWYSTAPNFPVNECGIAYAHLIDHATQHVDMSSDSGMGDELCTNPLTHAHICQYSCVNCCLLFNTMLQTINNIVWCHVITMFDC
jgi:hypothetical protein